MVASIAARAGLRPVHNRAGANLLTGIASALVTQTDFLGHPRGDLGLFEVDEANLPAAVKAIHPRVVALTNVFRDQLDRYGEVDHVARTWQDAVSLMGPDTTLVLNADDPVVAQLADGAPGPVVTFGMEHQALGGPGASHEADRRLCPRCGQRLSYTWAYYGHVGHYACSSCAWKRPLPTWRLTDLRTTDAGHSEVILDAPEGQLQFTLPLPGAYNAANALAAAAIGSAIGASPDVIAPALSGVSAVFGRQEIMPIGAGSLTLTLVKNPTGFNQVLHTMATGPRFTLIVVAINDLFADGTDVSWLWDVDFELLAKQPLRILCTGLRADDLAVRLKYSLVDADRVQVDADLGRALARAVETARHGEMVAVLPTYSAMLLLRRELVRLGLAPPFWEA